MPLTATEGRRRS